MPALETKTSTRLKKRNDLWYWVNVFIEKSYMGLLSSTRGLLLLEGNVLFSLVLDAASCPCPHVGCLTSPAVSEDKTP